MEWGTFSRKTGWGRKLPTAGGIRFRCSPPDPRMYASAVSSGMRQSSSAPVKKLEAFGHLSVETLREPLHHHVAVGRRFRLCRLDVGQIRDVIGAQVLL